MFQTGISEAIGWGIGSGTLSGDAEGMQSKQVHWSAVGASKLPLVTRGPEGRPRAVRDKLDFLHMHNAAGWHLVKRATLKPSLRSA